VRRHHARIYRSARHTLGLSDDPDDIADDIASRLHSALAAFGRAGPR
jgi:DNA-directed RNA polymerase specialized sigma24 family protein